MNEQEEIQRLLSHMTRLPGWCSEAKFVDIFKTCRQTNPQWVVEIGVFGGRSLLAFLGAIGCYNFIYGIDPYSRESIIEGGDGASNHDWWTQEELDSLYLNLSKYLSSVWGYAHPENILVRETSEQYAKSRTPGPPVVDILHIDGNHSELCSCRDVQLYLPMVIPGGLIYFDDINWPTTLKAQGMLAEQCDLLRVVDQCAVYRKR